ncbi:N-acetyltransferase [Clostridium sporogenes]|uniref:GNAT family N-acetyltransferase n=1 Tax=Clostridium botulinum TaxID=1491 RepID=UPI0007175A02|nr:GNAT family N-acetyltransferase [Clostridium botulinum]KRU27458.1 N-acetyltransferase [Clostridium sporogenes]KRU27782.1 N-acetyltransferase [Clostridium sporogenes]KRU32146.1 N-acetyltransferase [Clostridium sporogenes]KRU45010.1 N-acetyltransferase [Clostridium sporogenes]MBZ1330239.1 GNAT family N-acetyltransferase [Clostridium botulinum]
MIFQSKNCYVDLIDTKDLNEIIEVYNSNKYFVIKHMDKEKVTIKWILQEIESMKEIGFYCCKIVDISSEKIIGIMDFKIDVETYLSLLMIHNDYKSKGFGEEIFKAFEEYAKSSKSKCIKIDVVNNYNNSVLDFWVRNGFAEFKDVELNWTGKSLPAIIMKKRL